MTAPSPTVLESRAAVAFTSCKCRGPARRERRAPRVRHGHSAPDDFPITPRPSVKTHRLGAVPFDDGAVQRHSRKGATRARPGKNLGMHQRIGVCVRVPADRASRDIDVYSERELVREEPFQPVLVHNEENNIGGIRTQLHTETTASHSDRRRCAPASRNPASSEAPAVLPAHQECGLLHIGHNHQCTGLSRGASLECCYRGPPRPPEAFLWSAADACPESLPALEPMAGKAVKLKRLTRLYRRIRYWQPFDAFGQTDGRGRRRRDRQASFLHQLYQQLFSFRMGDG